MTINWVDIVLTLFVLGSFIRGYRAGLLQSIFSMIGFVGGGVLGLAISWHFLQNWVNIWGKFALLLLAISAGSSIGQWALREFAKFFHAKILFGPFKWLDSLLGATFSLARFIFMTYLVASLCLATPWDWAQKNIPSSEIYQKIDTLTPMLIKNVTSKIKSLDIPINNS
jgi:uncharacterized membrane protein required for colicin V production